ncbi:hypothetical protein BC940DRAFT_297155 [Gongronella butleri]|nr:hypothetical protein BC940DRAFT_297155 [Gongronella butleri]
MRAWLVLGIVSLVFWYLLQEYPAWRLRKLEETEKATSEAESSEKPPKKEESDAGEHQEPARRPSLSFFQYLCMIPMAAVYMLARLAVDIARHLLFNAVFCAERAAPHIDAWLFDLVTVRLPRGVQHVDQWWREAGHPRWERFKHHFVEKTLPACVVALDQFFLQVANAYEGVARALSTLCAAWRQFKHQHDWQKLAIDICTALHDLFWQPIVQLARLVMLAYHGIKAGVVATWDDACWLILDALPAAMDWIAQTRAWALFVDACAWCKHVGWPRIARAWLFVCSPLLFGLSKACLWLGDAILAALQSPASKALLNAMAALGRVISHGVRCGARGLTHAVQVSIDGVVIPLWHAYWTIVHPYLGVLYARLYAFLALQWATWMCPALHYVWVVLASTRLVTLLAVYYNYLLRMVANAVKLVSLDTVIAWGQSTVEWISHIIKQAVIVGHSAIVRHAPTAMATFAAIWTTFLESLDWSRLRSLIKQFHEEMGDQWALMIASLDRTLVDWSQQQQQQDARPKSKMA